MKVFTSVFSLGLFFSSSLFASWVVPTADLACTKDINPWGLPSLCFCPEASKYDQRIGYCVDGERYPILVQGVLNSEQAKLQGPDSGISLETNRGSFDLVIPRHERERLKRAHGLYFEAEGEFILLPDGQGPGRLTIIVDNLAWLE